MSARKKRWGLLLLRLLGLALLAYVFTLVEFDDTITLAGPDKTTLQGRIVGDLPAEWDDGAVVSFAAEGEDAPREYTRADLATVSVGDREVPLVDEGFARIVRRSDKGLLLVGFLMFGVLSHFGIWRWWLLLIAQGIRIPFWMSHRLTFIGLFFNNVVPGATGGDVIKAVILARRTEKGAKSVVSVVVDRVVGIVALALIAAVALLTQIDAPAYRDPAILVFGFLGVLGLCCVLFFSRRVRRRVPLMEFVTRLPGGGMIRKLDEAVMTYRDRKRTIFWSLVLSFANQLSIQAMMIVFATALHVTTRGGEPVPVVDYLVVLPVGFMVSAVPVLPGGWGVRETAFIFFFQSIGVGRNSAIALSVLGGGTMLLWSLLGGVYFLIGRAKGEGAAPAEAEGDGVGAGH